MNLPLSSQSTRILETSTESRALSLLGQGLGAEIVASAIGVSTSRISQLLSDPEFSSKVADLRYKSLAAHNETDSRYDDMERELQDRLKDLIPFMMKPFEVLKAIQIINAAKRRGASAPDSLTSTQNIVQLIMPTAIFNQFTTNINNQVVQAGEQNLVTVQSSKMLELASSHTPPKTLTGESNGSPNPSRNLET